MRELAECDWDAKWESVVRKMVPIDLLNKVATNVQFLENAISSKHRKGSAIKKACLYI